MSRISELTFIGLISFLTLQEMGATGYALAICYETPQTAISAVLTSSKPSFVVTNGGYRVTSVQRDPVLGKRWAMIISCDHPEHPTLVLSIDRGDTFTISQQLDRAFTASLQMPIVIHAGDLIRLWKQESLFRIEVSGISEESGGLGKTIRVRLLRDSSGEASMPERLVGIIRGPSNVEMLP